LVLDHATLGRRASALCQLISAWVAFFFGLPFFPVFHCESCPIVLLLPGMLPVAIYSDLGPPNWAVRLCHFASHSEALTVQFPKSSQCQKDPFEFDQAFLPLVLLKCEIPALRGHDKVCFLHMTRMDTTNLKQMAKTGGVY
jgi:hypothetical protein